MRFDTTRCDGAIVDNPHRIIATTDGLDFVPPQPQRQILPENREPEQDEAQMKFVRMVTKAIMGRWYADSILND